HYEFVVLPGAAIAPGFDEFDLSLLIPFTNESV
ncbi:MAG: hypothetical protein ACJASL_000623, partial [Paraglaciecola sp.]